MADEAFPIEVEQRGNVVIWTIDREPRMNSLSRATLLAFGKLAREAVTNPSVRAIVITGRGEKAFCAGQDLNETKTFDAERAAEWIEEWRRMYGAIRELDKPLIAALNGVAAGSAFQVALLADVRIGHPGVRMGQPEINSGIASTLGPAHFSLGIITGDRSFNAITSWLIPGDDDGKVSVDRARIEGADGFLVVPASHTFIMNREDVGAETLHFLEHGRFTNGG